MTQGNASTTIHKPVLSLLLGAATKRDYAVVSGDLYLNESTDDLQHKSAARRPSSVDDHDNVQKKPRIEECIPPLAKNSITGTLPYRCSYPGCEKAYRKKNKLEEHIRSHTGEVSTNVLHILFSQYSQLLRFTINLLQRPYVCPVEDCGKAYMRSTHLAVHARSHDETAGKPHHCTYEGCSSSFTTRQHLLRHRSLHERPLQFICNWEGCNAAFAKRYQLRNHTCTHTNKKPYPCTYEDCGSSFISLHKLQKHESTVHNEEKRYFCGHEGCNAQFLKWSQLQHHNKHEHEIMCPLCSKTFVKRHYLTLHIKYKHINEEQVECHWVGCNKTFVSVSPYFINNYDVNQCILNLSVL
jgi:general transcription factor IIIA